MKETTNNIKNEQVVIDWLDGLSKNTKRNYLTSLSEFCIINNISPTELLNLAYQEQEKRLPVWEQSITKWFKNYEQHHQRMDRSKSTRNYRTSTVKGFFHYYQILTPLEHNKRRNSIKRYDVKNLREGLTREVIRDAIDSCKSSRLRAMILVQCSSGLALTDLLNLRLDDYKMGLFSVGEAKDICMFRLRRGKTDKDFYTFISWEATNSINKYLQGERPKHFQNPYLFSKFNGDEKLSEFMVQKELRQLNTRMGHQHTKGLFRPITSHMFRKYFNTQLTNDGMVYEIRKHLMGHSIKNKVDDAYYLENPESLRKAYLEHIDCLLIYQTETVVIDNTEEDVKGLRDDMDRVLKLLKMKNEK